MLEWVVRKPGLYQPVNPSFGDVEVGVIIDSVSAKLVARFCHIHDIEHVDLDQSEYIGLDFFHEKEVENWSEIEDGVITLWYDMYGGDDVEFETIYESWDDVEMDTDVTDELLHA